MPFSGPLDDRQLIGELIADYCDAVNRRDDVAWGATWDEDGVWSLPFLGIEGIRGRAKHRLDLEAGHGRCFRSRT